MTFRLSAAGLLVVALAWSACAGDNTSSLKPDDWPGFRGPGGDGVSPAKDVPAEWSQDSNIRWKAKLPGPANSSPIVVGDLVFVTTARDRGAVRSLHCFRRSDGKELWVRDVKAAKGVPTHQTNPYSGSTPASDGRRVVVSHGEEGLYCYDLEGKELWSAKLADLKHQWGYGTSPVIHGGKVIVLHAPGQPTFVTALDVATGKTLWKTEEPVNPDSGEGGKVYVGTWSTPRIVEVDGKTQVVCAMTSRVVAYDFDSGSVVWLCEGLAHNRGELSYSSPHFAGDLCVAVGGFNGPSLAVTMGGTGDVTEERRLWRKERNPQSIGSGVVVDGYLYLPNADRPTITCIDPKTGKSVWTAEPGGSFWGSMVYADGRCYVTDQEGTTVVFRPNPKEFEPLAANRLGERCNSTPAVCNGQIIIRTYQHLYCIGG